MKKDIDDELYKKFLLGDKDSFESLYNKYKSKIKYFVYNIVKDIEEAEDITQDVFLYVMQNEMKDEYAFKYHIYLIAKSKAINYKNTTNRREKLNEKYYGDIGQAERNLLDEIISNESKNDVLNSIDLLEDKYKNALHLVYIENMSYKDTAEIIGESLSNTKNIIHRGKIKLYKLLVKKGFESMDKKLKVFIIVLILIVCVSGIVYATTLIFEHVRKVAASHEVTINPTFEGLLAESTVNNLWVGTLDLAWKKLGEVLHLDKVELEREFEVVNKLNESKFTKDMLSENSYELLVKQNELEGYTTNGFTITAKLNKNLTFNEKFNNFSNSYKTLTFGGGEEYIKYFGINNSGRGSSNVEVLFYNSDTDFAVKLLTKEKDEILLYRTSENKSFDEYFNDIVSKEKSYTGDKKIKQMYDELRVPYIRLSGLISYNELLGVSIKNTPYYIKEMTQDVDFELNESGCNLSSNATIVTSFIGGGLGRYFYYTDTFVLFMKEENKDMPYFAIKIDNSDILEKIEERKEIEIIDYTTIEGAVNSSISEGEYKFYEDDNYEYYYPNKKTMYVIVYFPDGSSALVANALKDNRIDVSMLDKFGVNYFKKEK